MKGQVGTLVKAMDVLDALGNTGPLGVMELSRMLKMDKSGVSRLLSTLKSREYVRVLSDGRHDLGLRLFELGHILQARMPVRQTVIPHVEALGRETGETASAAHYHLGQVSYLHDCISGKEIRLGGRVGLRCLPWHDVCGKAILAFCNEDYVLECLKHDQQAGTPSIPSPSELLAELGEIRKRGYALEKTDERCVIAAPVPCHHRPISIALMVGGPSSRLKKSDIKRLGLSATQHAQQAARSLGWKSNLAKNPKSN
ncbi:MAG: IclR family transcriptional regulator [Verrucomicrobiota bacterium]